jgi:hypothetical protein
MAVKSMLHPRNQHRQGYDFERALSQTSAVDASGPEPDIAFIQDHQKEAER